MSANLSSGPSIASTPSAPRAVALSDVLKALHRPTEPIQLPLLYRPAQLLVAAFMVVLPVLYLLLVAGIAAATAWHATQNTWMLEPSAAGGVRSGKLWLIMVLLGYVGPILAGSLAALFMVKPFFAPRSPDEVVPITVTEAEQPALFAFVNELCDVLEAPRPVRIEVDTSVNAGAALARGWRSVFRGDVKLLIGLPLAADLTLPQFAGILAHEFGHFAQGGGMRMSLVIRSINHWFARVVYERDGWDYTLRNAGEDGGHWTIMVCAWFTMLMVGIGRLVLRVLMIVGHVVSCVLLRQMEHDADRFESRIAGSRTFVETSRRMALLEVSFVAAMQSAAGHWHRVRELPNDLPALIRATRKAMPEGLRSQVLADAAGRKTHFFDTHPSMALRCEVIAREADPGVLPFDVPARVLFRDFDKLCRIATAAHYQRGLGDAYAHAKLVPSEQAVPRFQVKVG